MSRRCVLVGDEVLVAQCAEQAMAEGLDVVALVTCHAQAAAWATSNGLAVLDSRGDLAATLEDVRFDTLITVAYLRLVSDAVLAKAEVAVNFHDGPLPGYCGLNVTSWALLEGASQHAITWHLIGSGTDDGDVVLSEVVPVEPADTAFSLNARCYEAALRTFPVLAQALVSGDLRPVPQPAEGRRVFFRHQRPASATLLDPARPAEAHERLVRALDVGPRQRQRLGAVRLVLGDRTYLVDGCHLADPARAGGGAGIEVDGAALRLSTTEGGLVLTGLRCHRGLPVEPLAVAQRHGLTAHPAPLSIAPRLAQALDRLDKRIAGAEDRTAAFLSTYEPTALVVGSTDPAAAVWGEVAVALPEGWSDEAVVGVLATWLARRSGREDAVFAVTDAEIRGNLGALAPLARAPLARIEVPPAATPADLARVASSELARACRDGVWLGDLVARDPLLRERQPSSAQVVVELGGRSEPTDDEAAVRLSIDGGVLRLGHRHDAVDTGEAERFAAEIDALLRSAVDSTDVPARRLDALSGGDADLYSAVNDTAVPIDAHGTIDELFRRQAGRTPEAPALSFGRSTLTYAELQDRVDRFASVLRGRGVGHGGRVGIATPRSIDMVVAVLATLDCGASYVPLDPTYPEDRRSFMVEDADLAALVAAPSMAGRLAPPSLAVVDPAPAGSAPAAGGTVRTHTGADLAYVIYTSGSTGQPKGVMLEHRNVVAFFTAMDEVIEHEDPGVWLAVTSLSFDISVLELLWTLTRGFHVVLKPDSAQPSRAALDRGAVTGRSRVPRFSLFYFAANEATDADGYRLLLEGARFADRNGFEAVWIPERHFHEFGGIYPNPAVAAAAVASITTRVGIRAGSVVVPLHHPARIAEEWAVVDNLSGGRVGIAAAAGWQPDDFVLQPQNHSRAKQVMVESLDTVRRLWRGESVVMDGPRGPVEVRTLPRPVQPELPVWITSAGNVETFALAGRLGHHLLTHLLGQSVEQLTEKVGAYRDAWRAAGHEGEGHVTLMLHTFVHDDAEVALATARPHLKQYLRSAAGLLKDVASSFPTLRSAGKDADELFASLDEDELSELLEMATDRYLGTSGLFGDGDDAMATVARVAAAGVDEIACLIDFGIPTDAVLETLPFLAQLRDRASADLAAAAPPVDEGEPASRQLETVAELVARHGCTHLQCTPSLAAMLVADPADRAALGSLRHLLVGGEALPTSLAHDLRTIVSGRVTNMYGPTETTIWSLTHDLHAVGDGAVPIGRPIANTSIAVLDPYGERLPVGVFGELHLGGAGVARGYHGREQLTAERFVDRPGLGRMYATGDVVRLLPTGIVEFAGRSDFQVKIRGHRIELGEIESVLDRHQTVVRSVVTARGEGPATSLVAHVLLAAGSALDAEALCGHLGEHLPDIMIPEVFMAVDVLPMTPNGKIDRKALPAPPAVAAGSRSVLAPPADERERLVADIWAAALGCPVGRDDNFFDVGGHSLLAVKVFRNVLVATGLRLSLTDVFRYPTVRSFAGFLARLEAGRADPTPDGPTPKGAERGEMRRRAMQRRGGS